MKIGITCHPSAGGSGIVATDLGLALGERGHEVHFVTSERPFRMGDPPTNVLSHTVGLVAYPLFRVSPMSLGPRSEETRQNSSHGENSYAVFCLKKKKKI